MNEPNFDFMSKRKAALACSIVLVLAAVALLVTRGLNYGLDFTGGVQVELGFEEPVAPERIREQLVKSGFENGVVQNFGSERDILIRMPPQKISVSGLNSEKPTGQRRDGENGLENAQERKVESNQAMLGNRLSSALREVYPDMVVRRSEFVGPAVGEELREDGGLALLIALGLVMLYIMFRFSGKFAVGAVAALIHDVILVAGCFSLFQWTFDLTIVAAGLAVIGYSLNDTIVVSDRIRENFRKLRKGSPESVINISLNQTLGRTLVTSFTTLLVLVALRLMGGELISGFATALIFGVVVGTYSSIYVASNILLVMNVTKADLALPEKEDNLPEMP
ncbi:MAG: protein translocase subunit SecF [Pseudomonadales bacterium]|nr:protein translocase subunit SecF [Pseudomonadales bacterium]